MSKSVGELPKIEDVVIYWKERLAMFGDTEDARVAGYMANVVTSDHFDDGIRMGGTYSPKYLSLRRNLNCQTLRQQALVPE